MDLLFILGLLLKVVLTATVVVAASVVVERSGPFLGAVVAALPTSAGATYTILAIEHSPAFVAESAVGSIAANPAVAFFALVYAWLARSTGLLFSLGVALLVWMAWIVVLQPFPWTLTAAIILNVIVYSFTIAASAPFRT